MNKDEIDLSAYPSYLGVRPDAPTQDSLALPEAVTRGLGYTLLVGLAGAALGALVARQTLVNVNVDALTPALSAGLMVLAYTRASGAAPRRGLVPMLVTVSLMLVLGFFALLLSRAWFVYTLLEQNVDMPMSRSTFIWGLFGDPDVFSWRLAFPYLMCSLAGTCVGLWKVRRPTAD